MPGIIALQGGGPFVANDVLDARLLAEVGATEVVVLPTADAFEQPERLVADSMNWAERLDLQVEALMVLRRPDALDEGAAAVVRRARAVYLVGDQPMHLRSVLKDTPLWDALRDVLTNGGLVVQYTAEIVRDGDQIFIMREPRDKQAKMTYVGKLRGNRVIGTYAGGAWTAIVLR